MTRSPLPYTCITQLSHPKSLAHRAGIRTVLIPKDNERDVEDIPETVRKKLTFIPVSHMDEVLDQALVKVDHPEAPCRCESPEKEKPEP